MGPGGVGGGVVIGQGWWWAGLAGGSQWVG